MSVNKILEKFREEFEQGELRVGPSESIDDLVASENVSDGSGVYVISGCRNTERAILYIGKAGTICQDGSIKKQGLRQRLKMKQDGTYRKVFFQKIIAEMKLDALHIEWFVTYSPGNGVPPFLAESELLAAFLAESRQLPPLNKSA
ncbi:MAG: hypothetical protein JNM32_10630 [Dechloromonas sp.]|nr:hypothetical protein [Dechloromonas sp.]